jgi:hypothetical protein
LQKRRELPRGCPSREVLRITTFSTQELLHNPTRSQKRRDT